MLSHVKRDWALWAHALRPFFFITTEMRSLSESLIEIPKCALVKNLYENVYKNEKNSFYYENMKFFIIFKKLSQHMILVNISQQKVNTRSTHGQYHPIYQNVQNFIKKMNLVKIWFFGQQKATLCQHHPTYQNLLDFVKNGTLFKIWSFTQQKIHFSKWFSQIWLGGWGK